MSESRRLFGTDGIRGRANVAPMTPETALRVGLAVAHHFGRHGKVIVGKDTRRSSYMFEMAVTAGLCAMGADVFLVGPLPTPGIAHVTHSMRADAGVVISASHNPFSDNGIKLFAEDGFKLPDETERRLERLMASDELDERRAEGADVGRAKRIEDARGRYIAHVKLAFPDELDLEGTKVVVDCANGAGYFVGPLVFAELGADVTPLGVAPNGVNINDGCGALAPAAMQAKVREVGADIGIALDGDGDRAIFCDEKGRLVDGDAILALCARDLVTRGELPSRTVVGTVMSNMGLERSLEEVGVSLLRTPVGDRYVVDAMRRGGHVLGGEQSGHLVFLRHSTTGDGLVAALHVLAVMRRMGRPLSELVAPFEPFPQRTVSLKVRAKPPIEQLATLQRVLAELEREFMGQGRVLVRYSGTEPKIRLMVEARDPEVLPGALARLEEAVAADLDLVEGP
ncbi:MAG: phosphoglucosamine mutase [Deltaproteobacteria bacterium]|nr:MAG: phosphoglucosamine mutase [Deltaproteobacteria bacterium]